MKKRARAPESDIDCGGPCPNPCATGQSCGVAADCASGVCVAGSCQDPTCTDGVKNGGESDLDCGGLCPSACPNGDTCGLDADCASGVCAAGQCAAGWLTCAVIKQSHPDAPSGEYLLDPDGDGPIAPFTGTCDMTLDDGGWTLLGRGAWWGGQNDALPMNSMLTAPTMAAAVAASSKLFRVGSGAMYRFFITDDKPLFGTHYWRTDAPSVKCSLGYAGVLGGTMATTSVKQMNCDPTGIGAHACGGTNGWILIHSNDVYDVNGQHPCSAGLGTNPTGSALTTLWVR